MLKVAIDIGGSNTMENKNILMIVLLGIFLISNVAALGITPGRTTSDFSPGLEREVEFQILNTENKNVNIALSVDGDLAEYVNVTGEVIGLSSAESSKNLKYNIKLPSSLSPGLHIANVVALELPEDFDNPDLVIKATVSVVTQIYVYVPYPGKFIEATLEINKPEDAKNVNFYIPFISRGIEEIENVEAVIDIYKGEEKMISLNSNKVSLIKTGNRKELLATWIPSVESGSFRAITTITYDGEVIVIEKEFNVGDEDINLLGISVNNFNLGGVARIRILVQNKLTETISDAFANLKVYDSDLRNIADMKSENYEVLPKSNKEMIIYWDTEDLNAGTYNSELDINYNEEIINKNFKVAVTRDSMTFTGIGFVISGDGGKTSVTTILYIVIGLLVAVNIIWFMWYLRNKKHKKRNP